MQTRKIFAVVLSIAMLMTILPTAASANASASPARPFPQYEFSNYAVERVMPFGFTNADMAQDTVDQFNRILENFRVETDTSRTGNRNEFLMVLLHRGGTGVARDANNVTVCEAQGFGMLMLAFLAGAEALLVLSDPHDEDSPRITLGERLKANLPAETRAAFGDTPVTIRDYFDAMFRTMRRFPTTAALDHGSYLMAWNLVSENEDRSGEWSATPRGASVATDGALDMTYSLLLADVQWGGPPHGGTNLGGATAEDSLYRYWALGAMHQIRMTCVDRERFNLTVGNWAGQYGGNRENRRITRPSDFMLTHLRSFAEIGHRQDWERVLSTTFTAIEQGFHPTTGLLPDFLWFGDNGRWRPLERSPSDGVRHWNEGARDLDARYGWNACRVPWRLGLDILLHGNNSPANTAAARMNRTMDERSDGYFSLIRGGSLDGESRTGVMAGAAFATPYLVTAAAFGTQEWMTNGWNWTRERRGVPDNYGDYILVLSMIAASGNWWSAAAEFDLDPINTADEWARAGITEALERGFVPEQIQGSYRNVITREEFARLAVYWVEYALEQNIDAILTERGLSRFPNPFTDTENNYILAAYALGITSGEGDGIFNPDGRFTRQQAATMLTNTIRVINPHLEIPESSNFADIDTADDWARPGIYFAEANGIMSGTGDGNFAPHRTFTRQESIITFNNITF